ISFFLGTFKPALSSFLRCSDFPAHCSFLVGVRERQTQSATLPCRAAGGGLRFAEFLPFDPATIPSDKHADAGIRRPDPSAVAAWHGHLLRRLHSHDQRLDYALLQPANYVAAVGVRHNSRERRGTGEYIQVGRYGVVRYDAR